VRMALASWFLPLCILHEVIYVPYTRNIAKSSSLGDTGGSMARFSEGHGLYGGGAGF
jgi:hypothetical protein